MPSHTFKSSYLPEYLAWLMFLAGVANATLIWSGVFAAAPQAFLLLFGGLFGTAGIALLGLLMLATWCALGLLLAALTRLSVMRFKKYLLRQEKRTVTERVNYPVLKVGACESRLG